MDWNIVCLAPHWLKYTSTLSVCRWPA